MVMETTSDSITTDVVIREVRQIKERLALAFDYDIDRILADAKARQPLSGHKIISPPRVKEQTRTQA